MGGEQRWCVVTGGRGFAARHLVLMLIKNGIFSVRIADLAPSIKLEIEEENGVLGEALETGRAQYVCADLCDKSQVRKAFEGAEVVFHMAAPDSSINKHRLHYSVNVQGTQNVIDACIDLKVKRLIYTSSPSVVFDGVHGILNGNESLDYASKHIDFYSATKAQGEALVIKSNGSEGLLTCCIRPSSIFGPGDKLLVPSLVAAARAGKSKFIIGDGNNLYDFTYVENVAHAHICAERALASEGTIAEKASGQAYFITNMEPIKFWEFMALILEGLGYERPSIKIPASVMMPIAFLVESMYKCFGPLGMKVPQLTPSRVRLLSLSRTFDSSKANVLLSYKPVVSLQEGLRRTIESYSHLKADVQTKRDGPTKAELLLGGGIVSDTLLWRDKKWSLSVILMVSAFLFLFNLMASGYTIITTISRILLVAAFCLLIHSKLPQNILGYKVEKISCSKFFVSEETSYHLTKTAATKWNSVSVDFKELFQGSNMALFFKVVLCLMLLSILGAISPRNAFAIAVAGPFSAFVIYEKNEELVDNLFSKVSKLVFKLKPN